MAAEVMALARDRVRCVDATVGLGGHAVLLARPGTTFLAIDRDPEALEAAQQRLAGTGSWILGQFGDSKVLDRVDAFEPDFIMLDLGVSSMQLDRTDRGFSFRVGAPLDMRMSRLGDTAADLLESLSPRELERVFGDYGDERRARRLATVVARRRQRRPFTVADDFVNAIRETLGARAGPPDFARLFQALRIAVNDELEQIRVALPRLREALVAGGTLAVISYHSGEDRIVKHLFRDWARVCVCPPEQPTCTCRGAPLGTLLTPKPQRPSPGEVEANPRARSARLRAFGVQ